MTTNAEVLEHINNDKPQPAYAAGVNGKQYFVNPGGSIVNLNGEARGVVEIDNTQRFYDGEGNELDIDEAMILRSQERFRLEFEAEQQARDFAAVTIESFRHLAPLRRTMEVQDFAHPRMMALADAVQVACDSVTEIESTADLIKIQGAALYARDHKTGMKQVMYENATIYKNAVMSGALNVEGYHIGEMHPAGNGGFRVILLPDGVNSQEDYARTPEAIASGETHYTRTFERAVTRRKNAQLALASFQKIVREELALIKEAEKLYK